MSTPTRPDVTAIVLAGGRSTRFSGDKLAVDIDGRSVLDRALDAVAVVAVEVIVVGGASFGRDARRVPDSDPFGGPLQALAAGIEAAAAPLAIVVGGDMPALVPDVLALLVDRLREDPAVDAVVLADPAGSSRRQPLPVALRVERARAEVARSIAGGDRSIVRLLDRLRLAEIPADRWSALDPDGRTLVDIDEPADLDRLRGGSQEPRNR